MKIRANPNLPYSTLNPETSSDSPSAKSKGVRFVSARQEISQIPAIGGNKANFIQIEFILESIRRFKVDLKTR